MIPGSTATSKATLSRNHRHPEVISMAIALPTSADVRKARSEANKFVSSQYDFVRTPVLAWIGANDLALTKLRELPARLSREDLRRRADDAAEQAREIYEEWARRGEVTVDRIRSQPNVDRALRNAKDANKRVEKQVDTFVDQAHDVGEDILGRVSVQTRSIGEKTARRTQKVARRAATNVSKASDDFAGEIREAGDDAAHEARSMSRKAANRTAPAKPRASNTK
jgi:heparin binding hemagglutinin HbhA